MGQWKVKAQRLLGFSVYKRGEGKPCFFAHYAMILEDSHPELIKPQGIFLVSFLSVLLLGHGLEHIFKELGTEVNCFKKKGCWFAYLYCKV